MGVLTLRLWLLLVLSLVTGLGHVPSALAAARFSVASNNWNNTATWSATSGGAAGASVPVAGDTVTIERGFNVTVNVANACGVGCASVQVGGLVTGNGTLTFNAGSVLTVAGTVTLGNGARNGSINMTAGGTLIVQGFVANNIGTYTPGAGTFEFTANHTLPNNTEIDTFFNVRVSGGTLTLSRGTTVNGFLQINNLTALNKAGQTLTVAGALTVNGTLSGNGAGTLTLSGPSTTNISGTGSITETASTSITTGNKSIVAGSNLAFSGPIAIAAGITVTNNGTLDVAGNITGGSAASTWTNAANSSLSVAGSLMTTGILNAHAVPNTVNYDGAAQTVKNPNGTSPNNYYTLTLSGSGAKTMPAAALTMGGSFTMSGTATATAGGVMTVTGGGGGGMDIGNGTAFNASTFTHPVTGNLVVNGTISGTGQITLNGANKTIDGTGSITGTGTLAMTTGAKTILNTANLTTAWTTAISGGITVTNNGTFTSTSASGITGAAAADTWVNAANSSLTVAGPLMATGILTATANPNTVNYAPTVAAVTGTVGTYHHLVISTTTQNVTFPGSVTINGDMTDNGRFVHTFGNATFAGSAAQNLFGTASNTSFRNLVMANVAAALVNRKLTINHDVTAINVIFQPAANSGGRVVTGNFKLIVPSGGGVFFPAGGTESDFVAGNLQLFVAAGAPTVTFPVGTDGAAPAALGYSPVTLNFTGVTAAGGYLIVGPVLNDHSDIGNSGLDSTKSVNRWWRLTTAGVTSPLPVTPLPAFTNFTATFTFIGGVAPAGDLDINNTPNLEIERRSGTWNTTNVGTRTATTTQATGITGLGDFAIGEKAPVVVTPADFNAFETVTAAGAITGRIYTKLAGTAFVLDVVAIQGGAQQATFTNTVQVDLVTGAAGGLNCLGTPIAGTSQNVLVTSGRTLPADRPSFTVATAYPSVRVRVQYTGVTSCSADAFAIRPSQFSVSASLNNAGTTGNPHAKAGAAFTITAVAGAGYDRLPTVDNAKVTPHAGFVKKGDIAGAFGTIATGTGTAEGTGFTYSEVGNFTLAVDGVLDASFTTDSGDQAGGDCVAGSSDPAVDGSGKYGCNIGNRSVTAVIGRFTPDHFVVDVTTTPGQFVTGCGGASGFTYTGQVFNYGTQPRIVVTAKNSSGVTTENYTGTDWWKITNASLTGRAYSTLSGALDVTGAPGIDPVITDTGAGTGRLEFSSGTGFFFTRAALAGPFDAEISVAINVIDEDGVAYATNPARIAQPTAGNGIPFSGGKSIRFGRLTVGTRSGSQLVPLRVPLEAQYWNGTSFVTNAADSCTTLAAANIALGPYQSNLNACETSVTVGAFVGGRADVLLSAPGQGNNGAVIVTPNLGTGTMGSTCIAGAAVTPATAGNRPYLQGNWTGGAYDQNPSGRATFGVFRGAEEIIFQRENF